MLSYFNQFSFKIEQAFIIYTPGTLFAGSSDNVVMISNFEERNLDDWEHINFKGQTSDVLGSITANL